MRGLRLDAVKLQNQMALCGFETKQELATVSGIDSTNISHMVGRKYVQHKTLARLCKALNCDVADLVVMSPLERYDNSGKKRFILEKCLSFDIPVGEPVYCRMLDESIEFATWGLIVQRNGDRMIRTQDGLMQIDNDRYAYYAMREVD